MRSFDAVTTAALAAPVAKTARAWLLTRADGVRLGLTDHDTPLDVAGQRYEPGVAGRFSLEAHDGLAPEQAHTDGLLTAEALAPDDLANGLWDGAEVDVSLVDWATSRRLAWLWSGRLGAVRRHGTRFEASLLSRKVDLETVLGRVIGRSCDARLGDSRCGVDLSVSGRQVEAEVADWQSGALKVLVEPIAGTSPDLRGQDWRRGVTAFANGATAQVRDQESGGVAGVWVQLDRLPDGLASGLGVRLTVGCDKSFATCAGRFGNAINFRGFPHVPGEDALLAGPAGDGRDTGGRRG